MVRIRWAALAAAAGLAGGIVGCNSTGRPMFFHKNTPQAYAAPAGVSVVEGPSLTDPVPAPVGGPVASLPGGYPAPPPGVVVTPPNATTLPPAATLPPPGTTPVPVGPQPRTVPQSGANPAT